eukprot:gene795-777_t
MSEQESGYDVLVVGTGASGMSAAVTAAYEGLKVLVVDKAPVYGGTTARSGGWLWIPGTKLAKEQGISEPAGAARAYLQHETTTHFDAARVDAFIENGPKAIDFFTEKTCVQFDMPPVFPDYHAEAPGGQPGGRSMVTRPFDARELGDYVSKLAPPVPELTVFGMMLGSGKELWHFLRAFKSIESFWYVAKRFGGHLVDVMRYGRGMTLTNGNALAGRLAKAGMDLNIPVWLNAPVKKLIVEGDAVVGATVKVSAVFGPTNSGNAMAWKHIANQKKIPVIGNVGSGTDITKPMSPGADNYMFRVSMVDREQVAALMAYVKKNTGQSKVVGLMAETTGYGQGGLKDMEEIAKLQDIKIAATERFGVGDTDMTSQLSKMKSANVDTIVVWAQGTPIAQLVRSMEKTNYFPLVLTSWAADNITFYDAAGKALAEKPIFMRTVSETRTPAQQKLFDRIGAKLKAPGSFSFALHGYDSVLLYAAAAKQANSFDGSAVRVALEDLKAPVQGVLKTYDKPFSKANHEALTAKDLVWIRWKDGKLMPYADPIVNSLSSADFKQ